jgi:hypothetical protein
MVRDNFQTALEQARKELAAALEERSAMERRIINLKQTIGGLASLCEPEDEDVVQVGGGLSPSYKTSLTDAIRKVLSEATSPISPPEVRDALLVEQVDLSKYKQQMVPIHNTLKRLERQGEIVAARDDKGEIWGYRWVSPLARAVAEVGGSGNLGSISNLVRHGTLDAPKHPLIRVAKRRKNPIYGE